MKWIPTLCSWISLTLGIYAAGTSLHEENIAIWAPVCSVVVTLTYFVVVEKYVSWFIRLSSLLSLLGLMALGSAILLVGDCALGFLRAPSHALMTECLNDSEPGFSITAGATGLSLGVATFGALQLLFSSAIERLIGMRSH